MKTAGGFLLSLSSGPPTTPYLLHRTTETGDTRQLPLAEVDRAVLEQLRPVLQEALRDGFTLHVGTVFWIRACLDGGRLQVAIWHGPEARGEALVTLAVTRGAGSVPSLLEVSIAGVAVAVRDGRQPAPDVVTAMLHGKARQQRNAEVALVEAVTRWRQQVQDLAPERELDLKCIVQAGLSTPEQPVVRDG